jgi:hypothetical protein
MTYHNIPSSEEEDEDVEEVNEIRFFQPSFLSEAALQLRDRVQRSRQMISVLVDDIVLICAIPSQ